MRKQPGGLLRGFGGESRGGILGFAEHVGHFVLAANIGEAFEFASADGGEEDAAARGYLRFHFVHAGDDVAVKARAGPRRQFKLRMRPDAQRQVLEVDLRSFLQRRGELLFIPEIIIRVGSISLAVALVIVHSGGKMLGGCFANGCRLIEKDNWTQGAFRQLKE